VAGLAEGRRPSIYLCPVFHPSKKRAFILRLCPLLLLVGCAGGHAAEPPATIAPPPNLSPEFPVPSTLPDELRPAPRPYDCTLARGLGDCTQTPGPSPAVQGAPLPPPRPPDAVDAPSGSMPATPGVPKQPAR